MDMNSNIDIVNHPAHYKSDSGLEAIDVIESFTEGLQGFEATSTGNVLKYMMRWKKKNGLVDLKKAQWYLNRLIEKLESANLNFSSMSSVSSKKNSEYTTHGI